MKSILVLCLLSFTAFAQNYEQEIAEHRETYKQELFEEGRIGFSKEQLDSIAFFAADPAYLVKCKFKATPKAEPLEIPTYAGTKVNYVQQGYLKFKLNRKKYKLAVYRNLNLPKKYTNYLFLPFKDLTNKNETYGGGRYIDFWVIDLETKPILLDFNKAYNPYCAYSAGFACPVPPKTNHLPIEILAGEKKYKGEYLGDH